MPKCQIIDSDESDSDYQVDYSDYRPMEIVKIKKRLDESTSKWCQQYNNIKLIGEIKTKKDYHSFTIFDITRDGHSFRCRYDGTLTINNKKLYHLYGCLQFGRYGIEFCVEHIEEHKQKVSKLETLKQKSTNLGYFKHKRTLDYEKLNHICILSKRGTQGYTDFIEQLDIPLHITLKTICLEGENTKRDLVKAMKTIDDTYDLVLIMRGGGFTTDISLSFDDLEIFKSIRECPIPVMTAIGHTNDCHDSLLITDISDLDCHTPTTAATHLNNKCRASLIEFYNSYSNRYSSLLRLSERDLDRQWGQLLNKDMNITSDKLLVLKRKFREAVFPEELVDLASESETIYIRRSNKIVEYKLTPVRELEIDGDLLDYISDLSLTSDLDHFPELLKSKTELYMGFVTLLEDYGHLVNLDNTYHKLETDVETTSTMYHPDKLKDMSYMEIQYYRRQMVTLSHHFNNLEQPDQLPEKTNEEYNLLKSEVMISLETDIVYLLHRLKQFIPISSI